MLEEGIKATRHQEDRGRVSGVAPTSFRHHGRFGQQSMSLVLGPVQLQASRSSLITVARIRLLSEIDHANVIEV